MLTIIKPLKRFGQNFLTDKNIIEKIVGALGLKAEDNILEIGPGHGALTFSLAPRVRAVYAVEIDRGLCSQLEEKARQYKNVEIICQDALKLDLAGLARSKNIGAFKVVSNLPYYITAPLIEYFFKNIKLISDIYIMVQKEVAERMAALPGNKTYGSFTCFVNYYTKPKILFKIKRGSFFPEPGVDSCFLRLEPAASVHKVKSENLLFKIIRAGFGQRRKRLISTLTRDFSKDVLNSLPLKDLLKCRPEELSLNDFVKLSNQVFDNTDK